MIFTYIKPISLSVRRLVFAWPNANVRRVWQNYGTASSRKKEMGKEYLAERLAVATIALVLSITATACRRILSYSDTCIYIMISGIDEIIVNK